jgi:hypothetical protein
MYTTSILHALLPHMLFQAMPIIPLSYYMLYRHIHCSIQHHLLQRVLLSFYTLLQPYLLSCMLAAPSHQLSPSLRATGTALLSLARRLLDLELFCLEPFSAQGSLRLCLTEDVKGEREISISSYGSSMEVVHVFIEYINY